MKKYGLELMLGCLLLVSFLILSKQAAEVSETMSSTENSKIILVDAGHGGAEKGAMGCLGDAGHGGADPGMIGVNGLEEKGINLQIAVKLKDSLEKQGFSVIMTREEDKGLYEEDSRNQKAQDMQCRIAMIKKYRPVLCISVHQNSYQDSSVCGPQVFYYEDSVRGKNLAEFIQEELNLGLKVKRPRVAKGNKTYYLLKRSESVLNIVECGFLTNPEEAGLLCKEEYQNKIVEAIVKGIEQYLKQQKI